MHKYGAIRTVCRRSHSHPSKAEAARCDDLCLMERAGEIVGLEFQPEYDLKVNGQHICRYVADWTYRDARTGSLVVEDKKGVETAVFKIKAKLMRAIYGIEIRKS